MDIFDIIGPVMVGPSSSHTAGACRIGGVARQIAGGSIASALITMHGSFAATGKGHGTDKAVVGGLLGCKPDDECLKNSLVTAREIGLDYRIVNGDLGDVHPNTVKIDIVTAGTPAERFSVTGSSIGGGRIKIIEINGLEAEFSGDYKTLVIQHTDKPGVIAEVTGVLGAECVNIAAMRVYRAERGGQAVMVIETDNAISGTAEDAIRRLPNVTEVFHVDL